MVGGSADPAHVFALHGALEDALDDQLLLNRLSVAEPDREDVYLDLSPAFVAPLVLAPPSVPFAL